MTKHSLISHANLIIAFVGCITGIASLSWQIHDKYGLPPEHITAAISRTSDEIRPDKSRLHQWQFYLVVTNLGTNVVYVSGHVQGKNNYQVTFYPFKSQEEGDDKALQPGGARVYKLGPYSDQELIKLSDSLRQDVIAQVQTSRGTVVNLPAFGVMFAEALSVAKKNVSK